MARDNVILEQVSRAVAFAMVVVAVSTFAVPAHAASPDRKVPDGTFTYKIVLTGHGEKKYSMQTGAPGFEKVNIHKVVEITARMDGSVLPGDPITGPHGERNDAGQAAVRKTAVSPMARMQKEMNACGDDDQACQQEAMMRFRTRMTQMSPKQRSNMVAAEEASTNATLGRLDSWIWAQSEIPQQAAQSCQVNANIDDTEVQTGYSGGGCSGEPLTRIVGHGVLHAKSKTFGCATTTTGRGRGSEPIVNGDIRLTADPASGYYDLELPDMFIPVESSSDTGTALGYGALGNGKFPAVSLKGLKLPATGGPIGGKKTLPAIMTIKDKGLTVPVNAVVTWTFKPDGKM